MRLKILIAALAVAAVSPVHAETILLKARAMIDVVRGDIIANPVITISDGVITAIGSAAPEDMEDV